MAHGRFVLLLAVGVSAWTEIPDPGLGELVGHSAVALGSDIFIYGGIKAREFTGSGPSYLENRVGRFSGSLRTITWSTATNTPTARMSHSATKLSETSFVVFGGFRDPNLNDMHVFSSSSNSFSSVSQPSTIPARSQHGAAALDFGTWTGLLVVGGVGDSGVLGDAHLFNLAAPAWVPVAPAGPAPSPRYGASLFPYANASSGEPCAILYGGADSATSVFGDTWRVCFRASNASAPEWALLTPAGTDPGSSRSHAVALVAGRMLVTGGYTFTFPTDYLSATRQYDYRLDRWELVADGDDPTGRAEHAMARLPGVTYVFGGRTRYEALRSAFNSSFAGPECAAGSYSPDGSATCLACPGGTFTDVRGQYACSACAPGTYAAGTGNTGCTSCIIGKYSGATGASSEAACTACGTGTTTTQPAATSVAACQPCNAGFGSSLGAPCIPCAAGTHAPPNTGRCLPCGPGEFSGAVASACTACPAGSYNPFPQQSGCLTCPAGMVSTPNATACLPCAAGTASPLPGHPPASCASCPAGHFSTSGESRCAACPAGKASAALGATSMGTCAGCRPGSFAAGAGASSCGACSAGTYQPAENATGCVACPAGKYSAAVGASDAATCVACPAGHTTAGPGTASSAGCAACPAGTYEAGNVCESCPPGTARAAGGGAGVGSCAACIATQYQNLPGQTACRPCEEGTFSFTGWAYCLPCGKNTTCAAGLFSAGADNSTLCSGHGTCNAGTCVCDAGWGGMRCAAGTGAGTGVLEFTATEVAVAEGAVDVTVTRLSGSSGSVTFSVSVDATASNTTAGADYTAGAPIDGSALSMADGVVSRVLSVPIVADAALEGCEVLTLRISPGAGAAVGERASLRLLVQDDEVPERVTATETLAGSAVSPTSLAAVLGPAGLSATVTVAAPAAAAGALDVLFLLDASPYAADLLAGLPAVLPHLAAQLQAAYGDVRFGVASFRDKPVSPLGNNQDYVYRLHAPLPGPAAAALAAAAAVSPGGGSSDGASAQLEALLQSAGRAETGWRAGARRVAVVFTGSAFRSAGDCGTYACPTDWGGIPPNDGDADVEGSGAAENYPTIAQTAAALGARGIAPVFAVTAGAVGVYPALVTTMGMGAIATVNANGSALPAAVAQGVAAAMSAVRSFALRDVHGVVAAVTPASRTGIAPGASVTFAVTLRCATPPCNTSAPVELGFPPYGSVAITAQTAGQACAAPAVDAATPQLRAAAAANRQFAGWIKNPTAAADTAAPFRDVDPAAPAQFWTPSGAGYRRALTQGPFGTTEWALVLGGSSGAGGAEHGATLDLGSAADLLAFAHARADALALGPGGHAHMHLDVTFANGTVARPAATVALPVGTSDRWHFLAARVTADSAPVTAALRISVANSTGSVRVTRAGLLLDDDNVCSCAPGYYMAPVPSISWTGAFLRVDASGAVGPVRCLLCPAASRCIAGVRVPCTGLTYSMGGAAVCSPCPVGRICANGTLSPCLGTDWADHSVSPPVCRPCPAGFACTNGRITECPTGTFSANASAECFHCRMGTVAPARGATTCSPCQPGTTSDFARAACHACPPGHHAVEPGTFPCTPCPAGEFSPGGQPRCTPCPHGTYAAGTGNERCALCPAGRNTTSAGSASPAACG